MSSQLSARFFPSDDACKIRLSTMIKAGLIESVRIMDYQDVIPSRFLPLFQKLKIYGGNRAKLKVYRLGAELRAKEKHSQTIATPIFWMHQLELNDVLSKVEGYLKEKYPDGYFLCDSNMRREEGRYGTKGIQVPDIVWRYKDIDYAFEYERNFKNEMDYVFRFSNYQKSRYAKVIYVVENEKLMARLSKLAMAFPKIGFSMFYCKDVFSYFNGHQSFNEFLAIEKHLQAQGINV
ncbi:MAG: hypothetical protein KA715_10830 [Xanthomonadaceae bacterium]|nr:hypothetical protein [Xanthomonadaceae bacterium]